MTMTEPTLFDHPVTRGASRKRGPATSRAAGRSIEGQTLRDQQALVLRAVCALHHRYPQGANAWEVQCHLMGKKGATPQMNVIGKRLGELRDLGMLDPHGTRPGPSHREQATYRPTTKGRTWVQACAS